MDFLSRMPGKVPYLYTLIIRILSPSLYKIEWKAQVEAQTKGDRKIRKGGRNLALVLTRTSLSNSHFLVASLFSYLDLQKD